MAFNFGAPTQTPFGSTAPKPTAFGAPVSQLPSFGQSSTVQQPSAFGTTPFGHSTTALAKPVGIAAPSFGATPFATPQQPSVFGATPFGSTTLNITAPQQPQQSAFGTSAGGTSLSFGAFGQQQQSTFGGGGAFGSAVPIPKTQATGGLFGTSGGQFSFSNPATSKAPGSLFGTTATTQGTGLFGSTAPSGGLFGSTGTTGLGTGLFGSTAPTTATPSLFGSTLGGTGGGLFGSTAPTGGLFGAPAASTAPLFGTGSFGAPKPAFGTGTFGAAGSTFGTGAGLFGQPQQLLFQQQQQQLQQPIDTQELRYRQILSSLHAVNIFNDERDDILKKWNHLQASWGTGKGYFNPQHPAVEYNDCNPLYAFRGFGYFMMPTTDNSEGLVKMIFNKKETDLKSQRDVLCNGMAGILGNKPNLTVNIKSIKGISENDTEVTITVSEKSVTGANRTILATELAAYLNQPAQRQQLQGVGVSLVTPCVIPSKAQIQEYLRTPPPGIGSHVHTWNAAQADNPQPTKFLPMPMNGFTQLKKRMLIEDQETALHRSFLDSVNVQITELQRKHTATISQITEQKQKYLQLQHRVLQILVKQEVTRKVGMALQPEEEVLRGRLEMMYAHLNLPTQFRGQIQELLASVQIQRKVFYPRNEITYKMEPKVQEDIKQFLKMQQNGIRHLVDIINTDLKDLKTIFEGMNEIIKK